MDAFKNMIKAWYGNQGKEWLSALQPLIVQEVLAQLLFKHSITLIKNKMYNWSTSY